MKLVMVSLVLILCAQAAFSQTPPQISEQTKQQSAVERDPVLKLIGTLDLEGKVARGSIRKSEIDSWLGRRVYLGGNSGDEYGKYGLGFNYHQEGRFPAFSCQEWAQARRLGLGAGNNYELAMESFYIDTCSILFALKDAKPAKRSFIANPQVGLSNMNLLPVKLLETLSGDNIEGSDDAAVSKMRISQLVANRQAKVLYRTKHALTVEYEFEPDEKHYGYRKSFAERGRADFDGDGIEDIFVIAAWHVTQGTFRAYDYFLLTRRSPTAGFEIKEIELPAIKENPSATITGLKLKSSQLKKVKITKQTYGESWPFNQENGELACVKSGSVAVFWIAGGITYPLNIWARGSKIDGRDVATNIFEVDNGKNLAAVFNKAFAMCQTNGRKR